MDKGDKEVIPDFLKVPLALTAMGIPAAIAQMNREKMEHEVKMEQEKQRTEALRHAQDSLFDW